ncbi:MAG TPA: hypothetical protein ENJ46_03795 [Hellea balneolensis]|uniref:EF-hand domain-containing protein n=1 Tax=Hellea balneolensis TaxID=287478 RepID=A0A7C3CCB9_9PROT|nr:hypothetical protein [Hellea balneolensis]
MKIPMITRILVVVMMGLAPVCAQNVTAQIISQTPRPDIPADDGALEDDLVKTVTPTFSSEKVGNYIQVPRAAALLFAGFDQNGDYILDESEVSAGIERAFKQADKDGSDRLSLVELEAWRVAALGSDNAVPTSFSFAPNFARSVTPEKFTQVLQDIATDLDKNEQGVSDGEILLPDLLKDYRLPRAGKKNKGENCAARVREERRRVEQQCRTRRYIR